MDFNPWSHNTNLKQLTFEYTFEGLRLHNVSKEAKVKEIQGGIAVSIDKGIISEANESEYVVRGELVQARHGDKVETKENA